MRWIALKMLTGDKAKFYGIVLGLTFAALLITQQGSIFCGLMCRTAGQIFDITGADLWVMDANVRYIDDVKPMIENDLYRITFTNKGGLVKSWILKKFDDDKGQPLELVNAAASARYGQPLSLWAYDETLRNKLNSALYVNSKSGHQSAPADISFEYADPELSVRKKFSFDHSHVVHIDTSVRYTGVSFVYQFSGIFASGLTPLIAATLLHLNDNQPWLIAGYIVLVSIVSLISVAFLGDRTGKDLAEIDRMGAAAAAR